MTADALDNLLADSPAVTGVHAEPLELVEGFDAFAARFAHLPGTVVLLSGGELDCARYHLMGVFPWLHIRASASETILQIDGHDLASDANPFDVLRAVLDRFGMAVPSLPIPMAAGVMGYLAYDLKDRLEVLPRTSVDHLQLPAMVLMAPSALVVHDKARAATHLMVPQRDTGPSVASIVTRFKDVANTPPQETACRIAGQGKLQSNFSQEQYETAVGRIIDYISAGDVYQVNLSQRFHIPFNGDGYALFSRMYALNPAPFYAFVNAGDHQVISTSPERFLQRCGSKVETRPIKGTRPRGATAEQDHAMRRALASSTKDDAELSMIVDLLRNDIGKVCRAGSVRVVEHKRMEAYQNVYHLVSLVEGTLDAPYDSVDLVCAAFPGGSITGCPKVRAMEIIDELESVRRHVYCGSIGYFSFHDTMDLSIAIRTAVLLDDTLSYSVGGGVVFDSDPTAEYEETLHKGRTLSTACMADHDPQPAAVIWLNGRLQDAMGAAIPVDDQGLLYGHGFFETIRVEAGRAPLMHDHLARFNATWRALMPSPPPDVTWPEIIRQVVNANDLSNGCAAVKLLATRGSRTNPPWDHALLVTVRPYTHRLEAIDNDGLCLGTYPHPRQTPLANYKSINYLYYLRAGQWAAAAGFDEALILNPDDTISETNTANLLLFFGNEVIRPASAAVLAGVMTTAVCRELKQMGWRVVERPVTPDMASSADQVLATNALMGAVPVKAIDQQPLSVDDSLWRVLNDRLIPQWNSKQGFKH